MISSKDSISFRAAFSSPGVQMLISGGVLSPPYPRRHGEPPSFPRLFVPFPTFAVIAFINYIAIRSSGATATMKQYQRRTPLSPPGKYLIEASDLKEIKPRPYTTGLLQFLINFRRSRKYAVYADNARILSALDDKRASDVG